MKVIAEEDVVVKFNRLSMNMERVTEYTFTDRDDVRLWLEKA